MAILFVICWMFWIIFTFIIRKSYPFRSLFSAGVLIVISVLPLEWSGENLSIRPVIVLWFIVGCLCLSLFSLFSKVRVFIIASGFAFLFAAFRIAEWYEPVIFIFGYLLTYIFSFSILHIIYFRTFTERAVCAIIASVGGEVIYQAHMLSWTNQFILGNHFFLHFVIILVAVFFGIECLASMLFTKKINPPVSHLNLPGS